MPTQESLLTVLVVTGAWVVLELLKYAYAQLLAAATKRKTENARAQAPPANPGNSGMSAGELRDHLAEVKRLLGETRDAAIGAKAYARQTLEEVKK
jgi:hypothetical protein